MRELEDFYRVLAEGKKAAKEADVAGKLVSETVTRVKEKNPFAKVSTKPKQMIVEAPIDEPAVIANKEPEAIANQEKIDEILSASVSPVSPVPPRIDQLPELKTVSDKLKHLENWVSRIANTGPGSGEVNFRWLDDVNRTTMTQGNDNWLLEYDSATKKVQFTENVGPIKTIHLNQAGPDAPLVPGQISWNPDEDCVNIRHQDGTTLQVGLEQHMQVYNGYTSPLPQGTVVRFAGVNGPLDDTPIVQPMIADGSIAPLLTVGVMTTDVDVDGLGRATTFGKVRNLNTTGSDVAEVWAAGDILYVSPTNAGKLTKVKPTAPEIVVAVAAVLKVGLTDGIILVRPTIFPRLFYGAFSDTTSQVATVINTPYAIKMNTTNIASGHFIRNGSEVVAQNSGLYDYAFSLQLLSSNSASKNIWIWARKNGVDIPNSATKVTVTGNLEYTVVAWNFPISMEAGDYFQLMWATSDLALYIPSPPAETFCPAIPSVILTVTEAAL